MNEACSVYALQAFFACRQSEHACKLQELVPDSCAVMRMRPRPSDISREGPQRPVDFGSGRTETECRCVGITNRQDVVLEEL